MHFRGSNSHFIQLHKINEPECIDCRYLSRNFFLIRHSTDIDNSVGTLDLMQLTTCYSFLFLFRMLCASDLFQKISDMQNLLQLMTRWEYLLLAVIKQSSRVGKKTFLHMFDQRVVKFGFWDTFWRLWWHCCKQRDRQSFQNFNTVISFFFLKCCKAPIHIDDRGQCLHQLVDAFPWAKIPFVRSQKATAPLEQYCCCVERVM